MGARFNRFAGAESVADGSNRATQDDPVLYHDKERIVEPHDHGVRNGSVQLLGWQIAGENSRPLPCWLTVKTDEVLELTMRDEEFPGGRRTSSGPHIEWDTLFIRVKPADERNKPAE